MNDNYVDAGGHDYSVDACGWYTVDEPDNKVTEMVVIMMIKMIVMMKVVMKIVMILVIVIMVKKNCNDAEDYKDSESGVFDCHDNTDPEDIDSNDQKLMMMKMKMMF